MAFGLRPLPSATIHSERDGMPIAKQQMLDALDGLIADGASLEQQFLKDHGAWSSDFVAWMKAGQSTVEQIFGSGSGAYQSFISISFWPPPALVNEAEARALKVGTDAAEGRKFGELTWFLGGLRYANDELRGYRYSAERLAPEPVRPSPYIFLSHGGPTMTHVHLVRDLPSMGRSLNEKVLAYMGICAGGIVLATVEDEGSVRPNVEHEVGLMQGSPNVAARVVYLKESGVKFASNYSEKAWIGFTKERVQDAFVDIAKELNAFGFVGPMGRP